MHFSNGISNKDILSRISLGLTESEPAGKSPNIIVLPQAMYLLVNDYKTVEQHTEETQNEDGEVERTISYKLKDFHHDGDIDVFDGGGIDMTKRGQIISKISAIGGNHD